MSNNTFGKLKLGSTVAAGDMLESTAVKFDGSGDLIPCVLKTDECVGMVHNATNLIAGDYVDLNVAGAQAFKADGAIAAGDELTLSTTAGTVAVAITTNKIVGMALEAATDGAFCYGIFYTNKSGVKA